jgi:hypothetical protein
MRGCRRWVTVWVGIVRALGDGEHSAGPIFTDE